MLSESPCLQGLIGPQMGLSTYNQRHLGFGLECVNTHPYLHPPQLWDWTNRPMPLQHACMQEDKSWVNFTDYTPL
ncbi:unnamed protein product [Mesocestoides corti]|uniref:Uncharacterized protein n=1 Tax=Mesocestoides corti TaxID=53468 RepID=A0A0R3U831_MESCO|nr:unnamed protein product [Mesocestoides corti]